MIDILLHQLVRAVTAMADRACAERCCGLHRPGEYGLQHRAHRCERCPKDDTDMLVDLARNDHRIWGPQDE